ncbi:MAG: GNAT family N-acetyltransferase [Chloroflexota bacterium]
MTKLMVEEWALQHPRWQELVQLIADEKQTHWAFAPYFKQFARHFLVALQKGELVGFLMFVVWEIGPHDQGHPPLQVNGKTLMEAKVIAFGVPKRLRRQGIGRQLQLATLKHAKQLGCYQLRSVSDEDHPENHQLKLSMGFAVMPMERDKPTLTFVMPLQQER